MSSKYQIWLTHNGESEKLQLPVLPEGITIGSGSLNKTVEISGLGEIVIKQDRPALTIEFESFFPSAAFPGLQIAKITSPYTLRDKIMKWKNSNKPIHFLITGTNINMYCTIEKFSCSERGGDVGSIHYSLALKEYREVSARQVTIKVTTKKATLPAKTTTRTDNREQQKTYKVVKGDCLWNIAKKHLGNGSRYTEIYNLNKDIIKNPNLIYPGQVLKLPT